MSEPMPWIVRAAIAVLMFGIIVNLASRWALHQCDPATPGFACGVKLFIYGSFYN